MGSCISNSTQSRYYYFITLRRIEHEILFKNICFSRNIEICSFEYISAIIYTTEDNLKYFKKMSYSIERIDVSNYHII